ncbi:DUF1579 domain-containing protein [Pseudoalteromonas sp. SMS1]|uniref:DUF1579 domain-containing protein n=1 Tax=Pseudoalteromonas sp. SMS1 TaxID=2908894 RepID=UPI001F39115A|nr:DUF1579 domain-containing protein [Pseudoalteromonas sp. SMS1]MCF2859147.1 DUF1579 domain-containing protein [Pseudoalteromonas sp. SMS1]
MMLSDFDPAAPNDFDFIIGHWNVVHRRLKRILDDCNEWVEFKGDSATVKTLGGFGNVEDNHLHYPDASVRAKAIRSYNPETKAWSIWWLDGRNPHALDAPVIGSFVDGIGHFYAQDTLQGEPIKVRFIWNATHPHRPTWEQAFSKDNGETWETNWRMVFTKCA